MNRRRFLAFLGIAPAVVAAAPVLSATQAPAVATLGEWNNYYSESSPEFAKSIKEYDTNEMIGKWVSYKFQYMAAPYPPPLSWKGILR